MFTRLSILTAALAALAAPSLAQTDFSWAPRNTSLEPAQPDQFRAPLTASGVSVATEVVAQGFEHPWGLEVLPGGAGYLVTERSGALRFVAPDGTLSAPIAGVPPVVAVRQGGLLDVALAPDFAESRVVFLSYSKRVGASDAATAVLRGVLSEDHSTLADTRDVFVQEPAVPAPMHYGSRVLFDADGHLIITTGDRGFPQFAALAQDVSTTIGKVIRLTQEGGIPKDNPFASGGGHPAVWSYGHRNIQGALVSDGVLWTIEHGPKGGDELNRPEAGLNYGWPVVSYGENYNGRPVNRGEASGPGFVEPIYFWDPVIAPAGMHVYDGALFPEWQGDLLIGSLKPGGVVRLRLEGGRVVGEERILHRFDRVRDVEVDDDGSVLLLTDRDAGRLVRLVPDGD